MLRCVVHSSIALVLTSACTLKSGTLDRRAAGVDAVSVCRPKAGDERRHEVCHRWSCEIRDADEAAHWSGDASSCNAGDLDSRAAERALRLINLHRWLADVPPVVQVQAWRPAAQECALLAHANGKLSHTPPRDWACWTELAEHASSVSLIANRSAPQAIGAFIEDPGNEATMVHRRWLLSEEIWRVGLGSTDRYACVVVDGRKLAGGDSQEGRPSPSKRGWVAWPPAGPVPIAVFQAENLDEVGWTVQSANEDLEDATVTVTSDGEELAVRKTQLEPLMGSRSAIRFVPDGWRTEAGRAYTVRVHGATEIELTVEPVDCD